VGWKRRWAARGKRKEGGREVGRASCWAAGVAGPRAGKERREGEKREEGFGKFSSFFQTFSNSHFKLLKLNSFQNTKIFKTFLKAFKTSHKQIIKPCIQIMMHKHLLLLNY
jgi:hypothetical protein